MSKIMNDLKQLGQRRKIQNDILIEDEDEGPAEEKARIDQGPGKGVLVLGGLLVLLIVLSVISMTASVKIFQQLEKSGTASQTLIQNLKIQGDEIRDLKALVKSNSEEGQTRISALSGQLDGLRKAVEEGDKKLSAISKAHATLKESVETSLEDLKASSEQVQNKYILLNDKVKKLEDNYSIFYNVN